SNATEMTVGEHTSDYVTDGLSYTIYFCEIYGTCGSSGGTAVLWGSLWADANSIWRPGYNLGSGKAGTNGYPAAEMFQVRPHYYPNCDPERPQSPHIGGIHVCLGDGSVQFISAAITPTTWANANNPHDGQILGPDWLP